MPHDLPLIIGIGNEYRGDDAAGLIAARRLREILADSYTVLEQNGDGAALMEIWRDAEMVIIVDAAMSGAPPGTVHRFEADARPIPQGTFSCSTHAFGVSEAIELARALGRLPRRLVVYGIVGKDFAAGAGLSTELEEAVGEAVRRLLAEVNRRAD